MNKIRKDNINYSDEFACYSVLIMFAVINNDLMTIMHIFLSVNCILLLRVLCALFYHQKCVCGGPVLIRQRTAENFLGWKIKLLLIIFPKFGLV